MGEEERSGGEQASITHFIVGFSENSPLLLRDASRFFVGT